MTVSFLQCLYSLHREDTKYQLRARIALLPLLQAEEDRRCVPIGSINNYYGLVFINYPVHIPTCSMSSVYYIQLFQSNL